MPSAKTTDPEEPLQITVPRATKRSLKIKSAESGDTMRVIVLKALAKSGIQVPSDAVLGKRKAK